MTLAATIPTRHNFTGNDIATAFSYTLKIGAKTHIRVVHTNAAGAEDALGVLAVDVDYTVNGVLDAGGGSVDFPIGGSAYSTLATGEKLSIIYDFPIEQSLDLPDVGRVFNVSVEDQLDYMTVLHNQNKEKLDRSIKLVTGSTLTDIFYPEGTSAANRALKLARWDAAGTQLEAVTSTSISTITTKGDIEQGGTSGVIERLPIGTSGQLLKVDSGKLSYQDDNSVYRYIADPAQVDQGASSTRSIKALVDTIGANDETILLVPGTYTFSTSEVIPSNISLVVQSGAIFSVDSAKTLTVNGHMEAPINVQIMSGSGLLIFGQGSIETAYPEWWGIDGVADDVQFNQAITSMTTGEVRFNGLAYANTGTINIKDDVDFMGGNQGGVVINYSGSGNGIDLSAITGVKMEDFHINTSHNDANGIVFGEMSQRVNLRNVLVNSQAAVANVTGTGFLFEDNGSGLFTGQIILENCKVNSYKKSISLTGASTTTITCIGCILIGNSATEIASSVGLHVDGNAGAVGSQFIGGSIESFTIGYQVESGSKGFDVNCDFEDNTDNFDLSETFNGMVSSNNGGWFFRQGTNAGTNIWYKDFHRDGGYVKEARSGQTFVQTGAGAKVGPGSGGKFEWGFHSGGTSVTSLDSKGNTVDSAGDVVGQVLPQGGFVGSGGHSTGTAQNAYVFVKDRKLSFSTGVPAAGAWSQGSMIFSTVVTGGAVMGWACITTGQFEAVSTTCDTDGSTAVVTNVAALTNIEVGSYVQIAAGFATTGPFKVLEKNSTTSALTLDTNSNSSQSTTAVTNTSPTFKTMATVAV